MALQPERSFPCLILPSAGYFSLPLCYLLGLLLRREEAEEGVVVARPEAVRGALRDQLDSGAGAGTGSAPSGTAGPTGNRAGGAAAGRIDGTVTPGPAMQGDDVIRKENTPGQSKADKKIDSICRGC